MAADQRADTAHQEREQRKKYDVLSLERVAVPLIAARRDVEIKERVPAGEQIAHGIHVQPPRGRVTGYRRVADEDCRRHSDEQHADPRNQERDGDRPEGVGQRRARCGSAGIACGTISHRHAECSAEGAAVAGSGRGRRRPRDPAASSPGRRPRGHHRRDGAAAGRRSDLARVVARARQPARALGHVLLLHDRRRRLQLGRRRLSPLQRRLLSALSAADALGRRRARRSSAGGGAHRVADGVCRRADTDLSAGGAGTRRRLRLARDPVDLDLSGTRCTSRRSTPNRCFCSSASARSTRCGGGVSAGRRCAGWRSG